MPPKKQEMAFTRLRRLGMAEANKQLIADKDAILHCEKRGKTVSKISNSVMCSECGALLSRSFFARHRQRCHRNSSSSVNILATPVTVLNPNCNNAYSTDVLARFRNDEGGNICRSDSLCLLVGKILYQEACAKGSKKTLCQKLVMQKMRCLVALFMHIRDLAAKENVVIGKFEDIFNCRHFDFVETAIDRLGMKEDCSEKHGLKLMMGYLLMNICSILKGSYRCTSNSDDKIAEVEQFLDMLKSKWPRMFSHAENEVAMRRSNRKPRHLSAEEEENSLCYTNCSSVTPAVTVKSGISAVTDYFFKF